MIAPAQLAVGPSRVARWTQIVIGVGLTVAFSPAGHGQSWRSAASLAWLHHALPWCVFAVLFAFYTVLLAWGRATAVLVGNALGVLAFLLETIALFVTGFKPQNPGNPMVVAAMVLAVVLHARAVTIAATLAARKGNPPPAVVP
jgi:uncharacterized membrane protein YoaK (UPF0700 family)